MHASSVAIRFGRQDGAHGFDDPAVPAEWTIEALTARAVPRLRYPTVDIASGKALRYSMLFDGTELPKDQKVGDAFPDRKARVSVVSEYINA